MSSSPRGGRLEFLSGGGEMSQCIRSYDWRNHPLGPPERWPQSLKTAVGLILHSQHPMWIGWGPEMSFLYNDAYLHVLGLAKHPWALGRPAHEVWAEIWDVCGPLAERVFRQGQASFVDDVRLFMSRGTFLEETYYSFSYSPIPDESGNVGGLFCPSNDVTAKVLGARRLKTISELAANALPEKTTQTACSTAVRTIAKNREDVPFVVLYLISPDGTTALLQQSAHLDGLAGFAPERIALSDPAEDRWKIKETLRSALPTELPLDPGVHLPGPAGQTVRSALVVPVASRTQESPVGVLIAGVNPTRNLDADYLTFFELVASHVGSAIQNARSAEEERNRADQLAELDRAKTLFFSNVSHEFRTPLTLMTGPLEGLLGNSRSLGAEAREAVEIAHRNCLRLGKLVNALLDFSRIEAGRMAASYVSTDLATFTTDLASNFRSLMETGGLAFHVECEPLPREVYVDRGMWEKIVLNLLSNAFKFTLRGSVTVRLTTSGENAVLSVADTGVGIPEQELPRLFERFHRVAGAGGRSYEGTGIGLALASELVRLHGGSIQVKSIPSRGSTFVVTIPFGSAHLPGGQVAAAPPVGSSSLAAGSHLFTAEALNWVAAEDLLSGSSSGAFDADTRERWTEEERPLILLADDNADMRDYIRRTLGRSFEVVATSDGAAALEAAQARRPDLVLSDVMMPRLDGFGLLQSLRADPVLQDIPLILLSARAGEDSRIEGLRAGADDYLTKPFSAQELVARVEAALRLHRMRQQNRQELQELSDRLQSALDAANMVAWQWDLASGSVVCSPNAPQVTGGAVQTTFDESWVPVHPADAAHLRTLIDQAIEQRGAYTAQFRFIRPDTGKEQWMEAHGSVVPGDGSRPERVRGVVMDITKRHRAEALIEGHKRALELAVSGAPLQEILQAIAIAAEGQSGNSRCVIVQRSSDRGMPRLAALGSMPPGFASAVDDLMTQGVRVCMPTGDASPPRIIEDFEREPEWRTHLPLVRRFGIRSCWSYPIISSRGDVLGSIALFHAVPCLPEQEAMDALKYLSQSAAIVIERNDEAEERRWIHQRLQIRTEQFETLLGQAPMGVFVVNSEFKITHVNPTARPMFDHLDGVIGQDFREVVQHQWPERFADELILRFKNTLLTGTPYIESERVEARRDDGRLEYLEWRIDRIPLSGESYGVVCYFRDIAHQVRGREELARSEERFRTMANRAPVLIWVSGPDRACTWFNEPWLQFTGRGLAQELGEGWLNNVHPDDQEACRGSYHRAFDHREEFEIEYRLRRHDGAWRRVLDRGVPLHDGTEFQGYIGSCIDVTEIKEAEEALRTRTEELATILDVVPVPVWIANDVQSRSVYGNRAATELLQSGGSLSKTRLGDGESDANAADQMAWQRLPLWKAIETGETQGESELEIHLPPGRTAILSGSAVPLFDATGQVRGAVAAMMDITARTEWEQQLRRSEERLRLAMETGKVGVWDWDIPTGTVSWTESLYPMHGLRPGEFDGTTEAFLRRVHVDDREAVERAIERSLHAGAPYELTFRTIHPDGRAAWLYTNAAVLHQDGTPVRMLGATVDVSDLKRTEEELRHANQDLEQFAHSASHDLQEPLRSVKIYSELLSRRYAGRLDGEALEFLRFVIGGASRMESLVRDLLTYTQAARLQRPAEPVDANGALESALANLAGSIAESGAHIEAAELPHLRVHHTHLQQLFQNLVGNAIKYRSAHIIPRVHISAQPGNGYWRFAVSDNGIGIEAEDKEKIFGLFKRLHSHDEYSGTGIGLAICQRIVEHYDGRIWVESESGRGSTFYFNLSA